MKNILRHTKMLAIVLPAIMAACSDDDDEAVLTPLATPAPAVSASGVAALTFEWEKVEGAVQYAYELRDEADELVAGDVTTACTATFAGLEPATTYTLDVWAFAAIGSERSSSPVATLTATTDAIVPLAAPELTVTVDGKTVTAAWTAVPDAEIYTCYYLSADGERTDFAASADTSVTFVTEVGEYTFAVWADAPQNEAFSASAEATAGFAVTAYALYTTTGTMNYGEYQWECTLTAYSDGSYSIADWYGNAGYDLDFVADADGNVTYPTCYNDDWYVYVPTDGTNYDYFYVGYSTFEAAADGTCTLQFFPYYVNAYCTFTWNDPHMSLTTADIAGTYHEVASGYDYYLWTWGNEDNSFSYDDNVGVVIERIDDTTVSMTGFYWEPETLIGTLDAAARTITFEAGQTFGTWYTFAAETAVDAPVVATIDDEGRILFQGWSAWYGGYSYIAGATSTLTKL